MIKCVVIALALISSALGIGAAAAQPYPSRPVTMVVPFAAGGPTDVLARILAQSMSQTLGQQIVIENVTGAGGAGAAAGGGQAQPRGHHKLLVRLRTPAAARPPSKEL